MIKIALVGNPNCGKTTLFNTLTGSNQYVGNWPGVTVEKKEGRLIGSDDTIIVDLPGIYSLSPYTQEEVVARNFLIHERPDAILNIVDGTNLERNLYLTSQLLEVGIPLVIAINMMDVVKKNGDKINIEILSEKLGVPITTISALKEDNTIEAAKLAIATTKKEYKAKEHRYSGSVEHALAHIEEVTVHNLPDNQQRWYAIKLFERDERVYDDLKISDEIKKHIEADIKACEKENDDDSDSIIINERYSYIETILKDCYRKNKANLLSVSDKIDKVVTSKQFGLPVFILAMFLVYYISMVAVGAPLTNWTADKLFGDGFYLFGVGSREYESAYIENRDALKIVETFTDTQYDGTNENELISKMEEVDSDHVFDVVKITDEETLKENNYLVYYDIDNNIDSLSMSFTEARAYLRENGIKEIDKHDYGIYIDGIPVLVAKALDLLKVDTWLKLLICDGIIAGVGTVLSFAPQMFVLFFLLGFLESCGYMSRIAFVLDRLFRKFGLSGKSFIPILVGTGCSVPGIMASRTIESLADRRMTIITTSFIPCGAKVPFIALICGAIFNGSPLVAISAYLIGIAAIIMSGIILKKFKMFKNDKCPFVMELPAYHLPRLIDLLRSMWDRGFSYIKKAVTVILVSSIVVWFLTYFGMVNGKLTMLSANEIEYSFLANIGNMISWIFLPLGFGKWQETIAALTGILAKENIVSTLGIMYPGNVHLNLQSVFTPLTAYSFLIFNLLCAPCVAAISAIKAEMQSAKWTLFAIGYECIFAYCIALIVNQFGNLISGNVNVAYFIFATVVLMLLVYLIFRKDEDNGNSCS